MSKQRHWKHTPGPWSLLARAFAYHIHGSYGRFITGVYYAENGSRDPKYLAQGANARLIQKAPDMLQILERLEQASKCTPIELATVFLPAAMTLAAQASTILDHIEKGESNS